MDSLCEVDEPMKMIWNLHSEKHGISLGWPHYIQHTHIICHYICPYSSMNTIEYTHYGGFLKGATPKSSKSLDQTIVLKPMVTWWSPILRHPNMRKHPKGATAIPRPWQVVERPHIARHQNFTEQPTCHCRSWFGHIGVCLKIGCSKISWLVLIFFPATKHVERRKRKERTFQGPWKLQVHGGWFSERTALSTFRTEEETCHPLSKLNKVSITVKSWLGSLWCANQHSNMQLLFPS